MASTSWEWLSVFDAAGSEHEPLLVLSSPDELEAALSDCGATPFRLLVFVYKSEGSQLQRLLGILRVREKLKAVDRLLSRHGFVGDGRYFVYPELDEPFLIAELDSVAQDYCQSALMQRSTSRPKHLIGTVIGKLTGCPPTVAGVFVVARRQ